MNGELFLVATPIGNLGDLTFRAAETLKTVSLIACEDTRRTQKLMHHLGISKPLLRYDEHVHGRASGEIIRRLTGGEKIALVTDAGTPTISDPGLRLVTEAIKEGIRVVPIPGASSPIAALSASGMGKEGFIFIGFLPRKEGRALAALKESLDSGRTVIFLESPFRIERTLEMIAKIGPQIQVVVARELTKLNEEIIRGTVQQVIEITKGRLWKGEIVVLIEMQEK